MRGREPDSDRMAAAPIWLICAPHKSGASSALEIPRPTRRGGPRAWPALRVGPLAPGQSGSVKLSKPGGCFYDDCAGFGGTPRRRLVTRPGACSQRIDPDWHLADAGDGRPVGAEGADREPAEAVDVQLGPDAPHQPGELARVPRPSADQHPRRAGQIVGDEVAVRREVVAADAGIEPRSDGARQKAPPERPH